MDLAALGGFVVVFAVVGGFEVVDRTSFALIALASRRPVGPTFAGGAAAFVASSAIAVSVGAALVAVLGSGRIGLLRIGAGACLIGYALWLWYRGPEEEGVAESTRRTAFLAAFGTVLALEMGDTTMILEVLFVPAWGWLTVFLAGASSLSIVAAWDAWLGRRIGLRVEPALLHRIVVAVLLIVGALTIAYGLAPSAFSALAVATTG